MFINTARLTRAELGNQDYVGSYKYWNQACPTLSQILLGYIGNQETEKLQTFYKKVRDLLENFQSQSATGTMLSSGKPGHSKTWGEQVFDL